jgi:2-amino-4-hydroxy-6-hydroxymethyldihydropteridine diphosphokinase
MEYVWIEAISTAWDTPAVGIQAPDFLNAALLIDTSLDSPVALKQTVIRPVEACLGRVRTPNKNASRSIDIDVIIFDGQVLESQLWTEAFLAVPAAELVPNLFYPLTGETLTQIAQRLARCTRIEPRPEVLPGKWGDQQE